MSLTEIPIVGLVWLWSLPTAVSLIALHRHSKNNDYLSLDLRGACATSDQICTGMMQRKRKWQKSEGISGYVRPWITLEAYRKARSDSEKQYVKHSYASQKWGLNSRWQYYTGLSGTIGEQWTTSHFALKRTKFAHGWSRNWAELKGGCRNMARVPKHQEPYAMDRKSKLGRWRKVIKW